VVTSSGKVVEQMYGRIPEVPHFRNFLGCIRSRKRPAADIGIAHGSVLVGHMGNIAHRAGNLSLGYDVKTGRFDDADANKLITHAYRKGFEIPEKV